MTAFVFSWHYFAWYTLGMTFLYWMVFVLAFWIRGFSSALQLTHWFTGPWKPLGHIAGACAGAITPFCSCTTVPVFSGLISSGIPMGFTMSFLIASPLLDPPAVILFASLLGVRFTLFFIAACFAIAIVGGVILGNEKFRKELKPLFAHEQSVERFTWLAPTKAYVGFLPALVPVILLAATIATGLKGWVVPAPFIAALNKFPLVTIPAATGIGACIYAEIGLLIPVGKTLLVKGVHSGIIVAFLMAAAGLGIPSILLLSKIMRPRLLAAYVAVLFVLYSLCGYAVHFLL